MFGPDSARLRSHAFAEIPRTWTRTQTGPGNNREKSTKMIDSIYDVAFRYTRDARWEAYALSHSAYGFGDTLAEARKDITEALALLVEQPENRIRINEYHERLISAADEHHADVWLRVHHDADPNCALSRREIVGKLQNEPDAWGSFDKACHSTVTSSCWHACPTIYSVTFSHRWPAPTDSTWLFPTQSALSAAYAYQ